MMALSDVIKRLVYEIKMDTSGVPRDLAALEAEISAEMDRISGTSATAQIKAEKGDLDAKIKEARAQLDALKKVHADPSVGMDDKEFQAQLKRIRTQILRLKGESANIAVRFDEKGNLLTDLKKTKTAVQDTDNWFERLGKRITSTRVRIGPFSASLRAMTATLSVLAPILVDVGGGVVALGGSLAEAAAGGIAVGAAGLTGFGLAATGAALAIKPLITDMKTASAAAAALKTAQLKYGKSSTEAQNAQKALNSTLAGMPPQMAKAVKGWTALKAAFAARTGGIRQDFFSVITDGLKSAKALLPTFAKDAQSAFHVASQGVHEWLSGLRTPEAQHILDNIMQNFTKSLPSVLHGLGQFATAFGRIVSVASDFLPEFTRGFDNVAKDFANSTVNAGHLQNTIGGLVSQTHSWFALLGATGRLLTTVLTGGARDGQSMIDHFTATLNKWNQQLNTIAGQRSLHTFFADAATTTSQLAGVLQRVITLFFQLSRVTQPLAQGVLLVATALGDIVSAASKLAPVRAVLAGIGAAIATAFIVGKIQAVYSLFLALPKAIEIAGLAFEALEAEINPLGAILGGLVGGATALFLLFKGSGSNSVDTFTRSQRELHRTTQRTTSAIRAEHDALANLHNAHLDLQQANINLARDEEARHSALNKLNNAIDKNGKNSKQAKDANLAYKQTVVNVKRDEVDRSNALKDVRKQQERDTAATVQGAVATQHNITQLDHERSRLIKSVQADHARIDSITALRKRTGDYTVDQYQLTRAQDDLAKKNKQLDTITKELADAQTNQGKTMNKLNGFTGKAADETQNLSGKQDHAKSSGSGLEGEMRKLGRTLGGVGNVSHGMGKMIGTVTDKILSSFGAKKLNFSLPSPSSLVGGILQRGGVVGEQRQAGGGFTVPGAGDGDRYRTALPVGSFVMNRNASVAYGLQSGGMAPVALEAGERVFLPQQVRAIGGDVLHAMNSSVSRFATGGAVGQFAGMKPDIIALTKNILQRFGGVMSAGFATSGHAPNSLHYQGLAADIVPGDWSGATNYVNSIGRSLLEGIHASPPGTNVSWKDGNSVPSSFWGSTTWGEHHSHIHVATAQAVKSLAARIKKIAVKGPPGPLRNALQGQADTLRKAANAYIQRHMPQQGPETSAAVGPGTLSRNEMRGLLKAHNMPDIMGWVAEVESGFNPHAVNASSGAFGLWQDLPSTYAGLGVHGDRWDPNVQATANAKLYDRDGLSPWAASQGGWGSHQGQPFQVGGQVGEYPRHVPPYHHDPGPSQKLRLPPQPHKNPRKDYSTGPGSWYDWYSRAIDFYDTRGDDRNQAGNFPKAKGDWKSALGDIVNEEKQVRRIIHHDKGRIRKFDHSRLPKHLRKSKPGHFNFRKKHRHESHKDYHNAKRAAHNEWRQKKKSWEQEKKAWEQSLRQRKQGVKQELPDLYQQLRVDLPTRYHDIQDKIKGQAADAGLEQTAFGQERYQALLAYGGNFSALGFGVGTENSRFGGSGAAMGGRGIGTRIPQTGATPAGLGLRAPTSSRGVPGRGAGAGVVSIDNTKNIELHNHYEREPKDPHTWSATMRHEIGAMS